MKLKLLKPMGKMKKGEEFFARNNEQADLLVKDGWAERVSNEQEPEKELVLINPAPGVWTTVYKDKPAKTEADTSIATADGKTGETKNTVVDAAQTGTTATNLIASINAATTAEMAKTLVATDENRKTVLDALKKKLESFE